MTLQQLFKKLRNEKLHRRQFAWIVDIDEPTDGGFVGAVANAECELEDTIRNRTVVYIGTAIELAAQMEEFTLEQIDAEWSAVCESIDGLQAIAEG